MKRGLAVFVDPKNNRRLDIKAVRTVAGQIISGYLYNKHRRYRILRGIPRFAPEESQTSRSFGTKWQNKRSLHFGRAGQDRAILLEQLMALLGVSREQSVRKLFNGAEMTLNAGCGVAWPEYLFNYNPRAQRHCFDISLSVETAYKLTSRFKNVIVSQASIYEIPYADHLFDIVYSNGVIHHTPDPKKAFEALAKKVRPGGLIGIYIYCTKPFLRELADKEIRKITTGMAYGECEKFSRLMSRLGRALCNIRQHLVIGDDIDLLGIKKGTYSVHRFFYDHFLKCWFNPRQDRPYADLINQDWYHPYYASHHSKEEVLNWFKEAGVVKIKFVQPRGWEHSGYFVSGRKK